MPNHVHGILSIQNSEDVEDRMDVPPVETPKLGVSTRNLTGKDEKTIGGKNEKWKPGGLGVIINQYKRVCTINMRKTNIHFGWQSRYHDHIIRDEISYHNISNYIRNNPQKWQEDRFYSSI